MQALHTAERSGRTVFGMPQLVAEALGYALVAVLCAWMGISGLWSAFRLLDEYGSSWWTLATALPAALLALLKRRAPLVGCVAAAAFFAVDLLATGGIVPFIVLLDLLYALTVSLDEVRRRRVLVAVLVVTGAMTLLTLVVTGDLRITVVIGLQVGALLGTTYWYGTAVAQSRELVELHRMQAEDAKRLAELDRVSAVRGERERMARELHDVIAGHVAAVAIRSEAALADADHAGSGGIPDPRREARPESMYESSPERAALRAVRDSSLEAHEALRAMIGVLRGGPDGVVSPPGRDRVPAMVEQAGRSGVSVVLADTVGEAALAAPIDQAVARVVHEALANAVKHASGSEIQVRIAPAPAQVPTPGGAPSEPRAHGCVIVEVVSQGGSPIERPELRGSGWGLLMLEERVRSLGGEFAAGPRDGGWSVRARLPLEEAR